jgi:hypothetical protein
MDVTKWKSVLVPVEVYQGIRQIAKMEERTIGGQLKVMFDSFCRENGYEIKKKSEKN